MSSRSPVEKPAFRAICGLLIAVVVAVVWQAYRDDQTIRLVKAWRHSATVWLSAALNAMPSKSEIAAELNTKLPEQGINASGDIETRQRITELQQQFGL